MSRSIRIIMFAVAVLAVLGAWSLLTFTQTGSPPAVRAAGSLPFGPGWAADYGTEDGLPPVPDYGSQPHGSAYSDFVRDYGSQPHGSAYVTGTARVPDYGQQFRGPAYTNYWKDQFK